MISDSYTDKYKIEIVDNLTLINCNIITHLCISTRTAIIKSHSDQIYVIGQIHKIEIGHKITLEN